MKKTGVMTITLKLRIITMIIGIRIMIIFATMIVIAFEKNHIDNGANS